jgi:hypothetical protein
LIKSGAIGRFSLFTLTDQAEQDDDCAGIYHKSLLYLVSNAFEERQRVPLLQKDGEPILGMQKFVDGPVGRLLKELPHRWVLSPNSTPKGSPDASLSRSHGGFDDDEATLRATLAIVLGKKAAANGFHFGRTRAGLRAVRARIDAQSLSPR